MEAMTNAPAVLRRRRAAFLHPARIVLTCRNRERSKVFDVSFLVADWSVQPRFYRREQLNTAHCEKLTVNKRGGCTGDSVD